MQTQHLHARANSIYFTPILSIKWHCRMDRHS
jgi:hypothetical protein